MTTMTKIGRCHHCHRCHRQRSDIHTQMPPRLEFDWSSIGVRLEFDWTSIGVEYENDIRHFTLALPILYPYSKHTPEYG